MPLMTRDKTGTKKGQNRDKQGQNRYNRNKIGTVGTSRNKTDTIRDKTGTSQ